MRLITCQQTMRQNNVKKEIWLQNREESSAFNFERGKMEKNQSLEN